LKRIVAILVLGLLLTHFTGYYIYFIVRMGQIRTEMRQQLKYLPQDQLARFELTQQQYGRVRVDEHEIKVDGKMYDIARIEKAGNHLVVYAMHDQAEDDLLAFFNEIFERAYSDKGKTPSGLTAFMSLNFLIEQNLVIQTQEVLVTHCTAFINRENSVVLGPDAPPPQA
jgi:hypothetical protein